MKASQPWPLAAALLAIGLSACGQRAQPAGIASVAMKVLPAEGGLAYVAVDSTGKVLGGHLSGGAEPVAREDSARIPVAEAREIFAMARGLGDTLLSRDGAEPDEPPGSTVLAVLFTDDSQVRIVWRAGTTHPDSRVNALIDRLSAQRIGGW